MARPVTTTGLALVAIGAATFLWKATVLGTPILPSQAENLWRVELQIDLRGSGKRGSASAHLPSSDERQTIFDERVSASGLVFTIRSDRGQRVGVWRGTLDGVHQIFHGFRVQVHGPADAAAPADRPAAPSPASAETLEAAADLPSDAQAVAALLARLDISPDDEPLARARTLFGFVTDEIEIAANGSDDALLVLAAREGSPLGKARLLVTLLRASAIPARLAAGLQLAQAPEARELVFAEAWDGASWLPLFPSLGRMGSPPADLVVLRRGGAALVEAAGAEALGYRYRVLREQLRPEELAALMLPADPVLGPTSFYRLPLRTQASLRILLVMPVASLVVALFRNVIGLRTFGTFMPILIALAWREAGLVAGLAMVAAVLATGLVARLLLDRLRLLFVPRLCVLLCLVILVIAGLSDLGYGLESGDLLTGVLFPVVILTMLIERFSIVVAEEDFRSAFLLLVNSMIVASCAYPIFHSDLASHLMFGYPELVLCVMGALVWLGGYTGYRLSELVRFRALASHSPGTGA